MEKRKIIKKRKLHNPSFDRVFSFGIIFIQFVDLNLQEFEGREQDHVLDHGTENRNGEALVHRRTSYSHR